MNFVIDAHLPPDIVRLLIRNGHDAIHTAGLPAANATKDGVINRVSLDEHRVVVSKDADFYYSHLLQGRPWKLPSVRTGNISARDVVDLFERNLAAIVASLQTHTPVEVDRVGVTPVHP